MGCSLSLLRGSRNKQMKIDSSVIDWSARPAEFISELLPDIIFKFPDADREDDSVSAHKTVLVMVGRVFRNMFIVHNMAAKEMVIEDSGKQPFRIMMDAIYSVKRMEESLKEKSIDEMFAVLYLVTKYEIRELELAVKECQSKFPIREDNVLEVATNAMEYSTTFEEAARRVLVSCAKFLEPKFTEPQSFIRYVAENVDQNVAVLKLAEILNDLPPTVCSNCLKNPCQHGIPVKRNQWRFGLKVAKNPDFWEEIPDMDSEVLGILSDKIMKMKLSVWIDGKKSEPRIHEFPKFEVPEFVFKCKSNEE